MDNSRTGTNWPVLLFYLFIYLFLPLPCDSCHQDWRRPWNRTFNVKQHWLQFAHSHHKSHDPHCVCYLSDLLLFYFFHPKRYSVLSLLTCGFLDAMGRRSPWLALAPRWSSLTNHGHARPSWPSHHLIWQLGSLCVTVTVRRRMDPVATRCAPLRRANERTGGAGGRKCNAEADEQDKSTQPFPISTGIDTTSQRWATRGWPLVQ